MREWDDALGQTDEIDRIFDCERDLQCARIGVADILGGKDDHPARDEERILPGLDHPRHPVKCRIGIAAAHALDERGDDVVMLLAGTIVEQRFVLRRLADVVSDDRAALRGAGQLGSDFQRTERAARVTRAKAHDLGQRVVIDRQFERPEPPIAIGQRAPDESGEVIIVQRLEHEDAGAREQWRDHFEGRILGGRADQGNQAIFDVRQDRVLLRAIPSMNLVDEDDGALAFEIKRAARLIHSLAQLGDAGGNRRDRFEDGARLLREQQCDRGFAGAGRTPQDHRMERAGRDHLAEQLAWAEQMFLADDFVERARTHPIGQRLRHRMPRPEESIIVVGLAPCHCVDVIIDRECGGTPCDRARCRKVAIAVEENRIRGIREGENGARPVRLEKRGRLH